MAKSLVSELGSVINESLTAIEILPGNGDEWFSPDIEAHKRFLLIEGNLGVPQKVLYKAYSSSVEVFRRSRVAIRAQGPLSEQTIDEDLTCELLYTSAILVLINPGHQTAWNMRKLLVSIGIRDVRKELDFTTALLTLRDCAKQSLLWCHRRTLLRALHSSIGDRSHAAGLQGPPGWLDTEDEDSLRDTTFPVADFRSEFTACTIAAATYERNYFAWSHRFRCLDALVIAIYKAVQRHDSTRLGEVDALLHEEYANTAKWIEQHVSDYTAMQYRCRVNLALRTRARLLPDVPSIQATDIAPFAHASILIESYPNHEALWLYMRLSASVLPCHDDHEDRPDPETFAERYLPAQQRSLPCAVTNPSRIPACSGEAERQAHRLLAWQKRFELIDTASLERSQPEIV